MTAIDPELRPQLKAGALRMFDPMIAAVKRERQGDSMTEVEDLLDKMLGRFSSHRDETADHASQLAARLSALGASPSLPRLAATSAGAMGRARLGAIGGQNYGANARDAFVYEHLEIATLHLLEQFAERAADRETARTAKACRAQDEDMVKTINGNWANAASLMLASRGLPTRRPPED
jgi:ferritin-like metal-binding protein YciE